MTPQTGDMYYDILVEEYFLVVKRSFNQTIWEVLYLHDCKIDLCPEDVLVRERGVKKVA